MKIVRNLLACGLLLLALSCNRTEQKSVDPEFFDAVSAALSSDGTVNPDWLQWTREPAAYEVKDGSVEITTAPHTDLWQRTYYHFRNDNAPVLQMQTKEKFFSFVVKTDFTQSHQRFDQCGIVMYLDSENWLKGSVEFENESFQHLGSVATNNGYSDWATTAIPADVKTMWYRFYPFRHLRLLSGGIFLHGRLFGHEGHRVHVESPRRTAAGSGMILWAYLV